MKNVRFSGKLSFIWLVALLALIVTGVRFYKEVESDRKEAVQTFADQGEFPIMNNTFMDLMR